MRIRLFDRSTYQTLLNWFDGPPTPFLQRPDGAWWTYVETSPSAHALMASADGIDLVHLQVDVDEAGTGSLLTITRPDRRGEGWAITAIQTLRREWCPAHGVTQLAGYVEPENQAAIRLCESAGFVRGASLDADGMLVFLLDCRART